MDDVLASTPLFSALDPQGAEALRVSLQEIRVAKGQELFREGEPGDHLYLILDGKVKLGHGSPDGRESLMAILGPGEMFGELSLFDPGLRTSTATALTEATVLALGNEQLMPLLEGRPEVAAALLQALARRLRRTNEAMADLVFSDVPGRVAKALMELGEKFGTLTPEGLLVTHDMTQEELAQLVGASRETVNKALAEFGHRGWITLESRQVLITDVERLGKRAREFCCSKYANWARTVDSAAGRISGGISAYTRSTTSDAVVAPLSIAFLTCSRRSSRCRR